MDFLSVVLADFSVQTHALHNNLFILLIVGGGFRTESREPELRSAWRKSRLHASRARPLRGVHHRSAVRGEGLGYMSQELAFGIHHRSAVREKGLGYMPQELTLFGEFTIGQH